MSENMPSELSADEQLRKLLSTQLEAVHHGDDAALETANEGLLAVLAVNPHKSTAPDRSEGPLEPATALRLALDAQKQAYRSPDPRERGAADVAVRAAVAVLERRGK